MTRQEASEMLIPVVAEKAQVDLSAGVDDAQASAVNKHVSDILDAFEKKGVFADEFSDRAAETVKAFTDKFDPAGLAAEVAREAAEIKAARQTHDPRTLEPTTESKVQKNLADAGRFAANELDRMKSAVARRGFWSGGLLDIAQDDPRKSIKDMLTRETDNEDIRNLQTLYGDLVFASKMLSSARSPVGITDLEAFKKFEEAVAAHAKALNTTDASNWVITETTPDMIRQVIQSTDVARRIRRIDFPNGIGTMSIPAEGTTLPQGYIASEATTDDNNARFQAKTPTVGTSVSLTCKSIVARIVTSWEMQESSVIPIVPWARDLMQREMRRNLDDAIINGESETAASSHFDNAGTALFTDPRDHRLAWDGFREHVQTTTTYDTTITAAVDWVYEVMMTTPLLMGKYAQAGATAILCSHGMRTKLGWLKDTKGYPVRWADFPPQDLSISAGEMTRGAGSLNGFEIIPTDKIYSNLNSSGVYDGSTTTKTILLYVYLPAWVLAVRNDMRMYEGTREEEGVDYMVARWTGTLGNLYGTDGIAGKVAGASVTDLSP